MDFEKAIVNPNQLQKAASLGEPAGDESLFTSPRTEMNHDGKVGEGKRSYFF